MTQQLNKLTEKESGKPVLTLDRNPLTLKARPHQPEEEFTTGESEIKATVNIKKKHPASLFDRQTPPHSSKSLVLSHFDRAPRLLMETSVHDSTLRSPPPPPPPPTSSLLAPPFCWVGERERVRESERSERGGNRQAQRFMTFMVLASFLKANPVLPASRFQGGEGNALHRTPHYQQHINPPSLGSPRLLCTQTDYKGDRRRSCLSHCLSQYS